jgi:acetyltransferase-like isoleucine patch superfamily enzyme
MEKKVEEMNRMGYPSVTLYGMAGVDAPTIEEGASIGAGTRIGQNTYIGMNAHIGENCRIMQHVTICKDAVIRDEVFIGPNTTLLNDKYPPTTISQPPIVKDHVVIGGGCTIIPGVVLGLYSVVGAGSTVTKDVPSREVWCGNPAKFRMTRGEYDLRQAETVKRLKT